MTADKRFNVRKAEQLEVSFHTSANLAPESEWSKEASRIKLVLRDLADYDEPSWFHIKMSRKEALSMGKALIRYGEMQVEGEQPLATVATKL